MQKNNLLLAGVLLLGLFGLILSVNHHLAAQPNVSLTLAPTTASVSVDGKKVHVYKTGIVVPEGTHTVQFALKDFTTVIKTVTVTKDKDLSLTVVLDPANDDGYNYLKANAYEQENREAIIGKTATDTGETIAKKNPVTTILPYIDQYFEINYGASKAHPKDSTAIAVYITSYAPDGRARALAVLQAKGYDPAKLEIIYSGQ